MWRRIQIKSDKAVTETDSGTDSFFLPTGHAISDMMLVVRAKNAADHNAPDGVEAKTVIQALSEIRVEAGSRTFKQYDAETALAFATYRNGVEPYVNLTQQLGGAHPAGWQEIAIPIDFGRFAGDRVCALPAPLYKDGGLQMSLTYNFETTDGVANAFLTGAANHRYDLYANILPKLHQDSLMGMKVIEQTRKRTYTTKATGTDLITMSIDPTRMARKYLVSAYKTGIREGELISEFELMLNGKEVVMSGLWRGWQRQNAIDCNLDYNRRISVKAQTTDDAYYSKIPNVMAEFTATTTGNEDTYLSTTADQVTMNAQTADDTGMLILTSDVLPRTAIIDFDKDMRLANLLSLKQKKIQMRIENAGASGKAAFYEELIAPAVI